MFNSHTKLVLATLVAYNNMCTKGTMAQTLFTVLHFVSILGLNMPAVPVSNATQYIPAPGSPVDEACKSPILYAIIQCS